MSTARSLLRRVRACGLPTLVSGVSLLGVAVGCSESPAFVEATTEIKRQPVAPVDGADDAGSKSAGDAGELNTGARAAGEVIANRTDVDPAGDPLANAPGSFPGDGNPGGGDGLGGTSGVGSGGGAGGGLVGSGGAGGTGGTDGSRGGSGENPGGSAGTGSGGTGSGGTSSGGTSSGGTGSGGTSSGGTSSGGTGGGVVVNPTPVPTMSPGRMPRAGTDVVYETRQVQGKVDILWVVDDSNSMDWAQSKLREKFEAFARRLSEARVDFRVGVTSTDVCDIDWETGAEKPNALCPNKNDISAGAVNSRGEMVGPAQGRLVRDPETGKSVLTAGPDFALAFSRTAKLGVAGSGMEHGLTAAKFAIDKALSGVNKGFLRSDAFLSVIVLSDEEDDGVQMWCQDAWGRTSLDTAGKVDLSKCRSEGSSPYVDKFKGTPYALYNNPQTGKPWSDYRFTADMWKAHMDKASVKGPGKFRLSAITGIRGADGKIACDNPDYSNGNGPRESGTNYVKAAELTGGVVENICAPEWDRILSNVGRNVGELANKIALPAGKIPWPGSIEVWVDGVRLDAAKFVHESEGNYLVFKQIPGSGAAIKVRYLETVN